MILNKRKRTDYGEILQSFPKENWKKDIEMCDVQILQCINMKHIFHNKKQ